MKIERMNVVDNGDSWYKRIIINSRKWICWKGK